MSEVNRQFAAAGLLKRIDLIVWLHRGSDQRRLRKYGDIVYYSARKHYVIMYVDQAEAEQVCQQVSHLPFVKRAEISNRDDLHFDADYQTKLMQRLAQEADRLREENEDLRV
ncbi:MAG: YlbG family protein [Lactobacillus sp.]|jgi:uncharacterized protein YlbG (UPF0298 family)|nr:YlbG family protein [Lactobacillus sp.]MCH3906458.1 YlbG family protein [Lactobacillus sp.]MCH3989966.1 YlbG family protein [Lactobacillus sp.]MCH4069319.1 YlbG family protein [Lactobacillus sp.]MCI1303693.1 YlbG family protein [Lactobacillus sp.]